MTSLILVYYFCAATCLFTIGDSARILAYFPVPSISHQVVFRPLIHELARRGHEVVTITTDPAFPKGEAPANLTEIDVHDISYEAWTKSFIASNVTKGDSNDWIEQADVSFTAILNLFEEQLRIDEVKKAALDKRNNYDLVILEACVYGTLALSHIHKVPVIQISSFGALEFNLHTVGAPTHVYLQPTSTQQTVNPEGLWNKLYELYMYYRLNAVHWNIEKKSDATIKRIFGPSFPSIRELTNNVDLLFLNVHSLWEINRPVPPNVVYMGGIHQNPSKEIPQDLKSYLDSSKNGVIYVTFGTNVDPALLPADRIELLLNVFSKLSYDVLFKWNRDEMPGRPPNVRIFKWLPQSDLLRHPKVKLFITQGGLQSTDEAISAGVPLIGVPMLGDQWFNAELYVYHGIGKRMDLSTATEGTFLNAINNIIDDERYRNNVVKLRSIIQDSVQTPLERAVWWTEYVIRHGGAKHLRSPLANITWTQYLELELVLLLSVCLIIATCITMKICCRLCRIFSGKPKLKKS